MMRPQLITYIIKTNEGEYYCGKTKDIDRRFNEHQKEKYPHWFAFKKRKQWENFITICGDYEQKIKRAGVKMCYEIVINLFGGAS